MKKVFLILTLLLNPVSLTFAQANDVEPNNTCTEAEIIGAITLPYIIDGSLDTPPEMPDVDFFQFNGDPGTVVRVDYEGAETGKGTLWDPYLGLFDSACNLINYNDDSGSLNSRLQFSIPADGIFILAASSCCDWTFSGQGGSSGTYQITIDVPPPAIGSISGRLVDAVTELPLPGDAPLYSFASLYRCSEESCFEYVAFAVPDQDGRFRIELDYSGNPLDVGAYQIIAYAYDYETTQTEPFAAGENENLDLGNIPLQPPPVQFSEIRPCGALPSEGGRCLYSVRITNNTPTRLSGTAWSVIQSYGIGSRLGYTEFQAPGIRRFLLLPGRSMVARFFFDVPNTVADGASICAQVFVGQGRAALFDTLGVRDLFCISKGLTGTFRVLSQQASQRVLQQSKGKHEQALYARKAQNVQRK